MSEERLDIDRVAAAVRENDAGWEAGHTTLVDLSPEDRRLRLGAVPPEGEPAMAVREEAARTRSATTAARNVPASVDLRADGYITPIRDQGSCGSCVAFGCLASIEGTARAQAKDAELPIDLSEAHLFYCHAAAQGSRCATGWWVDPALDSCRTLGVVAENDFPYTPGNQACQIGEDSTTERLKIVSYDKLNGAGAMKEWLATQGPLVACFSVYEDFYAYRQGVYRHVYGDLVGGHCVCVIGYDDSAQCWTAKNSWGAGWGEEGFFQIAYGECGIDFEMWGVAVPEREHDDAVWLNERKVTGLWINDDDGGVAVYVDGAGWKRLTDKASPALATVLTAAKVSGAPTDLRLIGDVVREVYVL